MSRHGRPQTIRTPAVPRGLRWIIRLARRQAGRFLLAAGKAFPDAELVAVEIDPLAALLLRANAAVHGVTDRLTLRIADYRATALPEIDGRTLFPGNPPHVRHHAVAPEWKQWLSETAARFGFRASRVCRCLSTPYRKAGA